MDTEQLNHWHDVIISKIEHVENSGNGAQIHEVRHHKNIIVHYHAFMNDEIKKPLGIRPVEYYAKELENALNNGEKYLSSLVA